jgi:hypothetical protein
VYKLTQKSGVYSVRTINKHRYKESWMISKKISLRSPFQFSKGLCDISSHSTLLGIKGKHVR